MCPASKSLYNAINLLLLPPYAMQAYMVCILDQRDAKSAAVHDTRSSLNACFLYLVIFAKGSRHFTCAQ